MAEQPLLLLDEPFSEQHEEGVEKIRTAIDKLEHAGTTILIAGHVVPTNARVFELEIG